MSSGYELDPTGTGADNLVTGEEHDIGSKSVRYVIPKHGPFFYESLVITDSSTGRVLTKDIDYVLVDQYEFSSVRFNARIGAIVLITDKLVASQLTIRYQILGGEHPSNAEAIKLQLDAIDWDSRSTAWPAILNKSPDLSTSVYYKDAPESIGFEYLVQAIYRMSDQIQNGLAPAHDKLRDYVDAIENDILSVNSVGTGSVNQHIADTNNSHQLTPSQISAFTIGEVNDIASRLTGPLNNHLGNNQNPHGETSESLNVYTKEETAARASYVSNTVAAHIARTDNPHSETAAQISAYPVWQVDSLLQTTKSAINSGISAHTSNTSNPHGTTAAQVGSYSSAQLLAIVGLADKAVSGHIGRTDNPHKLTAAQVNTYTAGEFDGVLNSTSADIQSLFLNHANIFSGNPHGETAASVGTYTDSEVLGLLSSRHSGFRNILDSHAADGLNPHKVTISQINSLSYAEFNERLASPAEIQYWHEASGGNVHWETPQQLGMYDRNDFTSLCRDVYLWAEQFLQPEYTFVHGMVSQPRGQCGEYPYLDREVYELVPNGSAKTVQVINYIENCYDCAQCAECDEPSTCCSQDTCDDTSDCDTSDCGDCSDEGGGEGEGGGDGE